MSRLGGLRPLRVLALGATCALLVVLLAKYVSEFERSRHREQMVKSIMHEQFGHFSRARPSQLKSASVSFWMVSQLLENHNPEETSQALKAYSQAHPDAWLKERVTRWTRVLDRWALEARITQDVGPEELLSEARKHFYEASGYGTIGQKIDALPLYLWSASLLSLYLDSARDRADYPEAIYIMGADVLALRDVLPVSTRSDRLLRLCSELYPESVWASQADMLFRNEIGNEI